jgi:hypothetical protein
LDDDEEHNKAFAIPLIRTLLRIDRGGDSVMPPLISVVNQPNRCSILNAMLDIEARQK